MHRTNHMLRTAFGLVMLGLALGSLSAGVLPAQEVPPPPRPLAGAGNVVIVPIGGSRTLQMKGKQDISQVFVQREEVASVTPSLTDLKSVIVRGLQAGRTTITLTAADEAKTQETYEVVVQLDVEFLRTNLQQVVPTANLVLTPVGGSGGTANMLAISGTVAHIEDINVIMRIAEAMIGGPTRVINQIRVPAVQQVQLDVVIARVSRTELRQMDFDFANSGLHHDIFSHPGGLFSSSPPTGNIGALPTITLTSSGNTGNVYVGLYQPGQWFSMFMNLLRTEQLGKLLAEPKLVTMSGKAAYFQDGGTFFLPATGGLNATAPQAVQFGTRLSFMPLVMGDGKIYLEVEPDISNISGTIAGSPSLARQSVRTVVTMEDGQTFVIGGLIQNTITADAVKIPLLGDMPFIGVFFAHKQFREEEFELVVMVTPHLVDPLDCRQVPKLLPGQETRSPDDFELFLENILEAPRGQRDICHGKKYVPAWKHAPNAAKYPCTDPQLLDPFAGRGHGASGASCCGSGLAEPAAMSYPSVAPASADKAAADSGHSAALLPPVDLNEASAPPAAAPASDAKPASLFGPTGYNPQQ